MDTITKTNLVNISGIPLDEIENVFGEPDSTQRNPHWRTKSMFLWKAKKVINIIESRGFAKIREAAKARRKIKLANARGGVKFLL